MASIAERVARRHVEELAKQASTPEQWELGGEILDKGEAHPAIKAIKDEYNAVIQALHDAASKSKNLKRVGVGRTEDPTLVVAHVVPAIEELSETAKLIAHQLKTRLGGH